MIDKLKLAHIDHANNIIDKGKMHREQENSKLIMRRNKLIKVNSIC